MTAINPWFRKGLVCRICSMCCKNIYLSGTVSELSKIIPDIDLHLTVFLLILLLAIGLPVGLGDDIPVSHTAVLKTSSLSFK